MRCASCGFANPEGMKFCGQCAASLQPQTSAAVIQKYDSCIFGCGGEFG